MSLRPENVLIYHITDVANLPGILAEGGLHSDVAMAQRNPTVIGYTHIKERRMKQIRVGCCGGRFVGEFVAFYYCPRSPMLTRSIAATPVFRQVVSEPSCIS